MRLPGLPLSREAILYGLRELARRAGVAAVDPAGNGFESLGLIVRYGPPEPTDSGTPSLVIVPAPESDWAALTALPAGSLESLGSEDVLPPGAALPVEPEIPVLLWGATRNGSRRFVERRGKSLVFGCDLVGSALFMLSRWEEMVVHARDEHERFPHTESVAFRQGFLERPIVDEYALILRAWLEDLVPGWKPQKRAFDVKLSHDIDVVRPFWSLSGAASTFVRDLWTTRSVRQARQTGALAWTQTFFPKTTEYFRGIERLANASSRHGTKSAFYFMAAEPSTYDSGYDPRWSWVRDRILRLRAEGFEIGFHAGYRTFDDPSLLAAEKSRLDEVLGETRYGGRQHFLRFRVPETWRYWERLGLTYDSTMTFAGHEGFRCGTCHPYRPFDLEANRVLELEEVPLIVMDGTLRQYRRIAPAAAAGRVLELARRCRAVEGTFTLLWHNSSLTGEWRDWSSPYETMVAKLSSLERNGSARG